MLILKVLRDETKRSEYDRNATARANASSFHNTSSARPRGSQQSSSFKRAGDGFYYQASYSNSRARPDSFSDLFGDILRDFEKEYMRSSQQQGSV
jgi:hypothetical protein